MKAKWATLIVALAVSSPVFAQQSGAAKVQNFFGNALRSVGGLFNGSAGQLKELVEKEQYHAAHALWLENRDYFASHAAENAAVLDRLAAGLNAEYEPRFEKQITQLFAATPNRQDSWPDLKVALGSSDELLREYDQQELLAAEKYRSPKAAQLAGMYKELIEPLKAQAPSAFLSFDHLAGSFFNGYPLDIKLEALLEEIFRDHRAQLAALPPQQIGIINKAFSTALGEEQKKDLAQAYVAALARSESPGTPRVISTLRLASQAKRDGFEQFSLPAEWKIGVLVDGPAGFVKLGPADAQFVLVEPGTSVDQALATVQHLIVLRPMGPALAIQEVGSRKVSSSYVVGKVAAPNEAYRSAYEQLLRVRKEKAQWEIRQQDLDRQARSAGAFGALLAGGTRLGMGKSYQSDEREARQRLRTTPMVIAKAVERSYEYEAVEVEVSKSVASAIYVVDGERKTVAASAVALQNAGRFELSTDVDSRDPAYAKLQQASADFGAFRSAAPTITIDELGRQLGAASFSVSPYAGALPAVAIAAAPPAGDETRKFVSAMQQRLARAKADRTERLPQDQGRLARASEEASEASEQFQRDLERMGADAEDSINTANAWAAGLRQLGDTIETGQARIAAARQGRIYTPPAGQSSGDAMQDELDRTLKQIGAGQAAATSQDGQFASFNANGAGGNDDLPAAMARANQVCSAGATQNVAGHAAAYRAAARVCQCYLDNVPNSPSRGEWSKCVRENTANADALRSDGPIFVPTPQDPNEMANRHQVQSTGGGQGPIPMITHESRSRSGGGGRGGGSVAAPAR
jgi:hypothetical protein